ncbi:response regulator [Bdellovibrionota bacterium FG-2]
MLLQINRPILVVEDDDGIQEMLKIFLELEGYSVFTASNGKDGLEVLQRIPRPSLILLDLMMPVMNGWEFAAEIQKDAALATIPIVVVTAYGNRADTIQARKVIEKPIDLEKLLGAVQDACGAPGSAKR